MPEHQVQICTTLHRP